MKILILVAALASIASGQTNDAFPYRVQFVTVHSDQHLLYQTGNGFGNITDGRSIRGFEYAFTGCGPLRASFEGKPGSPAKWMDTQHRKLEVVLAKVGSNDKEVCNLKVTLHDVVYVLNDQGQMEAKPMVSNLTKHQ